MNDLERFLALPNVDDITGDVFVSPRLGTFKVKAMSQSDLKDYQRRASGKFNKNGLDFDTAKFSLLVVAGQTVEPNFSNAEFLKKAGCVNAEQFISSKLLAGEISTLVEGIQKISGFDNDINEDVEEAKN